MTGMWDWHDAQGLSRVINVSGTMTGLGASVTAAPVQQAVAAAMGRFVKMHELQARASEVIARLTGAEAGFMTASASAGVSLSLAGCMTGLNPGAAEALPRDPGEAPNVVVQMGHLCGYGAPISQAVELTGGAVRSIGQSTLCTDYALEAALDETVAAALYVVSHHVVHYGQIPLRRFAEICHARGVPVVVDAASEYDLRGFLAAGADIVNYSGHKFLGGPTSGIVAGRRDLVRAGYLQNIGIGRGMKIGKESIAGVIAALEAWETRDHAGIHARERAALDLWTGALAGIDGVAARIVPDPTGNPLDRLEVHVDAARLGAGAGSVAGLLAARDPAIIVRDHEVELGYFQLDPCNLLPGQAEIVAESLVACLNDRAALAQAVPADARNGGVAGYLQWGAV
ncbi:aminotransferase class V-fold PLP-dependent enzyme [Salipiger abyssi]|uniref:aminotransferase class V-fold PLP-dependent enzyme n=1 Tax=Salipiger abyssi TaxID=1250539 RepID=UPI001A8C1A00|nr:aminotransferase class V-fold PLP-dependent enzyme [Salipiger abyssi]MBN9887066.1 aminotransferase class V-fold PLP-dependent enzyme [Salipiger abyssi]